MDFPWDGSTLRYKRVMNFTSNGRLIYQWDRDAFLEEMLGVETVENKTSKGNEAIYSCDGRRISQRADRTMKNVNQDNSIKRGKGRGLS